MCQILCWAVSTQSRSLSTRSSWSDGRWVRGRQIMLKAGRSLGQGAVTWGVQAKEARSRHFCPNLRSKWRTLISDAQPHSNENLLQYRTSTPSESLLHIPHPCLPAFPQFLGHLMKGPLKGLTQRATEVKSNYPLKWEEKKSQPC